MGLEGEVAVKYHAEILGSGDSNMVSSAMVEDVGRVGRGRGGARGGVPCLQCITRNSVFPSFSLAASSNIWECTVRPECF